jgi:hypothetical protein
MNAIRNRYEVTLARPEARDIEAIANETHCSVALVRRIYQEELASLAKQARITNFLPVIASRRTRQRLRNH